MKLNSDGHTHTSWLELDMEAAFFPDSFFHRTLCSSGISYLQSLTRYTPACPISLTQASCRA